MADALARLAFTTVGIGLTAGGDSIEKARPDEPVSDPNATLAPNAADSCTPTATLSNGSPWTPPPFPNITHDDQWT